MTLLTPWAIDGARTSAARARQAQYDATGGAEGVSRPGDLKVSALDVPGLGVQIAGGGALILTSADRAKDFPQKPVYVLGTGESVETGMISQM